VVDDELGVIGIIKETKPSIALLDILFSYEDSFEGNKEYR